MSSARSWKADLELLDQMHATLRASVAPLTDRDLARRIGRSAVTVRALVAGVAAHDLYHAGQVQLLKRLQ